MFYARKLYMGNVSINSQVVEYCKRLGRKLIVDYQGARMLIKDLDNFLCDGQTFIAHHSDKYMKAGNTYKLYDYIWAPIEAKHEEPEISMEGRLAMLKAWKDLQKGKQLSIIK